MMKNTKLEYLQHTKGAFAMYPDMVSVVPEGEVTDRKGNTARVKHFEVTDQAVMLGMIGGDPEAWTPTGMYAGLVVNKQLVMSDTYMERRSNREFVDRARGRVIIAGLGLGMILWPVLAKAEVTHVMVVEKVDAVIELVLPSLRAAPGYDKLHVDNSDIFDVMPKVTGRWDTIYFDIWPGRSTDNLEEIKQLHNRWKTYKNAGGWMNSWYKEELQSLARRERSLGWR